MGYWRTLHLFDDKKFYEEVVPTLKGQTGDLSDACLEFLKSHVIGGISHLSHQEINRLVEHSITRIISISNSLDKTFKINSEFQNIKMFDDQIAFLNKIDYYYNFCKFFEYYVFKTCADFHPHLALGKGGVKRNFNIDSKTLSNKMIGELDDWNHFLCGDQMGITNWITHEEVEFIYLDKANLLFNDNEQAEGFLTLLEVAHANKISFIMGVDMREDNLKLLPKNKILSLDTWKNKSLNGLLFER